jgi:hypothetical protein
LLKSLEICRRSENNFKGENIMPRTKNKSKLKELRNMTKTNLQKLLDKHGVKGLSEQWKISKSSVYKIINEKNLRLQKYKNLTVTGIKSKNKKNKNQNIISVFWPCFVKMVCKKSKCHIYYGTTKNPYWNPEYCLSWGCVQIMSAKYRDGKVYFDKEHYKKFW